MQKWNTELNSLSEIMSNQAEQIKLFSIEVIELLIEFDSGKESNTDHAFKFAKNRLNNDGQFTATE